MEPSSKVVCSECLFGKGLELTIECRPNPKRRVPLRKQTSWTPRFALALWTLLTKWLTCLVKKKNGSGSKVSNIATGYLDF